MGGWACQRAEVWACAAAWLALSSASSAPRASVVVTVEAAAVSRSVSLTNFGLSLPRIPDASEMQRLSAQGVRLVAVPIVATDSEPAWAEQWQRLAALMKSAKEWGTFVIWRLPDDEAFVRKLLEKEAAEEFAGQGLFSPALLFLEIEAGLALRVLKERPPRQLPPSLPGVRVLLREPPMEFLTQKSLSLAEASHYGFSLAVAANDERLSQVSAALQRAYGDEALPLLARCDLRGEAARLSVGVASALKWLADARVHLSCFSPPESATATAALLRAFRLLSDWAGLDRAGVRVSCPPPLVALGAQGEDGLSLCLANNSPRSVPAQLQLPLPPGAYRVEVRQVEGNAPPSPTGEKPPLWVAAPKKVSLLSVQVPPHGLTVVRLTSLVGKAYNDIGALSQHIAGTPTLTAREKTRALFALRRARQPLAEVLNACKFTPEAISRAAHRALLQVGQAEAVFRNEVAKGRVRDEVASVLIGQFEDVTHLLSDTSAVGIGLRLYINLRAGGWSGDDAPSVELAVGLTHRGNRSLSLAHVEIALQADETLTVEPLTRRDWTRLPPQGAVGSRFRLRALTKSTASSAEPMIARVTASYYAERSHVRLSRVVEWYEE
ncbi:MAG: hypothetical protein NZT92_01555 [Abditibacteriales bacterium]|nr:hypothetical protein [Abditibacteriales bacterium]MDW8364598.1 hypothetical protein [Abditibacteriales bacterium]